MPWWDFDVHSVLDGVGDAAYAIAEHPWYAAAGAVVASLSLLRGYCRYSVGMCHCATDLTGKTVVITGGNAGIGKATAMELAKHNARVILGSRSLERGSQAVKDIKKATGNQNVAFEQLDLCSFDSVRRFADRIKETGSLHILINNAGVTGSGGKRTITKDGCEYMMQANHFGHFLLTLSLLDLMKRSAPSRIVNVSSMVYEWGKLDLEDLHSTKRFYPTETYNKTKLANILFTKELSKRLRGTGVTVNALHPGVVKTDIVKNTPVVDGIVTRMLFSLVGKTPLEGAQTTLHVALSPELEDVSGRYFSDCKEQKLKKIAQDEDQAKKLFKISEVIVGFQMESGA